MLGLIRVGRIKMPNYQNKLWYPYAQMKTMEPAYQVTEANGAYIQTIEYGALLDAISSWWCVIYGYNHPKLNQALIEQSSKMSHVMLGGLSHKPAIDLANALSDILPGDLNHVFFADSGSVGVEVSLKMALQYWINKGYIGKSKFCSLRMGYHGDTLTAMSVGDPDDSMHHRWQGALTEQFWVQRPVGDLIEDALIDLERTLNENHHQIAAFICEPILQCWGGFNRYSPEYLNRARLLCDQYNVLMIFDEVATGFGRTGKMFATEHCDIIPDIIVLSKALTGGYLGLSATVASEKVFQAFYDDRNEFALMHGPTFMANALACSVALAGIQLFQTDHYLEKSNLIDRSLQEIWRNYQHPLVKEVKVFGAGVCVEFHSSESLVGLKSFAAERGVWLRPFEKYMYSMPAYILTHDELKKICQVMQDWIKKIQ
jgi:adenosylmethionine---8-amino-7-oxononanoate aminotransferase